jgi:hypothetical protein
MLPAATTASTASSASWIRRTMLTRQLCPHAAGKADPLEPLRPGQRPCSAGLRHETTVRYKVSIYGCLPRVSGTPHSVADAMRHAEYPLRGHTRASRRRVDRRTHGGSARDYLPGFAWFCAPSWSNARAAVRIFIGALGVSFLICRVWHVPGASWVPESGRSVWA